MSAKNKVVVIGLDGATWALLDPMITEGLLPNLAGLRERGAWGTLRSTIPFVTAPAWTSFATGKNPGKHGLFDWRLPLRGDDAYRRFANARHIQGARFWDLVARAGRAVGILNVPMTYPPQATSGFMVSGMLTPSLNHRFAEPQELEALLKQIPGFQIDLRMIQYDDSNVADFVRDLTRMTQARFEAARRLIERYDPDLLAMVFLAPDRIQHMYWHLLDPDHPRYDARQAGRLAPLLKQVYRQLDDLVGRLVALRPAETLTVVMSDHGFGPALKRLDLNRWLEAEGLLTFDRHEFRKRRRQFYVDAWGRKNKRIYRLLSASKRRLLGGGDVHTNETPFALASLVDWSQSRAYAGTSTEQGIWINLAGREPHGVVQAGADYEAVRDQIVAGLTGIRDPETGQMVVRRARRREEVYTGDRVGDAPDIMLDLEDGYEVGTDIVLLGDRYVFPVDGHYLPGSGCHRREGVFIVQGPEVLPGRVDAAKEIVDLAPTILYAMGQAVPGDMDGRVMTDILRPEFVQARPVVALEAGEEPGGMVAVGDPYEEDDERVIQERLAGLGYLG